MRDHRRLPRHDEALEEWNRRTAPLEVSPLDDLPFTDLFDRVLPKGPLTCLEVGAIPGRFLAYLALHHGYRVTGIDFADNHRVFHDTMAAYGIDGYEFIHGDFFSYDFQKKFDVVASFGFVEHFEDIEDVIARHCDLVAAGGYLVISVPNFRYLRYAYHFVFDRPSLAFHNLHAMDQKLLERIIEGHGFEKKVSTYYGKMMFWRDHHTGPVMEKIDGVARRLSLWLGKILPVSKVISPFLILVYRRGAR